MKMLKTIEEINIRDTAQSRKTITEKDLELFAQVTGDYSEIHFNEEYAKETIFKSRIVHGLLIGGLISGVIGTQLPGSGSIYERLELRFIAPVFINDEITTVVTVESKNEDKNRVKTQNSMLQSV